MALPRSGERGYDEVVAKVVPRFGKRGYCTVVAKFVPRSGERGYCTVVAAKWLPRSEAVERNSADLPFRSRPIDSRYRGLRENSVRIVVHRATHPFRSTLRRLAMSAIRRQNRSHFCAGSPCWEPTSMIRASCVSNGPKGPSIAHPAAAHISAKSASSVSEQEP